MAPAADKRSPSKKRVHPKGPTGHSSGSTLTENGWAIPTPKGWMSKRSLVAALCYFVSHLVLTIAVIFEYAKERIDKDMPGSHVEANYLLILTTSFVGGVFADFVFNRRRLLIISLYVAGALIGLGGAAYFIDYLRKNTVDAVLVCTGFAWVNLVLFVFVRAVYEGTRKEHRSLWVAIFVVQFFGAECLAAVFRGLWVSTGIPVMQVLFIVDGVVIIATASYLVTFKECCTPVYGAHDCKPRGKEFVGHLQQMRKFWKNLVSVSSTDLSFAGTIAHVDHRTAHAIGAIKLVFANTLPFVCIATAAKFPMQLAQEQMDHMRHVFIARYDNLMTVWIAIPVLSILQRWKKSLRIPHGYFAVLVCCILASLSHAGLQIVIDQDKPHFNNCEHHHVVLQNRENHAITFGEGYSIHPNQTIEWCSNATKIPVVDDVLKYEVILSGIKKNGTLVVFSKGRSDTAYFQKKRNVGKIQYVNFNLSSDGNTDPFHHTTMNTEDRHHEFDNAQIGATFAHLRHYHTHEGHQDIELVPPYGVDVWYLLGPLIVCEMTSILAYWFLINVALLAPQEVGCTMFGVGYACGIIGRMIGTPAGKQDSAVAMFIATAAVGTSCGVVLTIFACLFRSRDVRECQCQEAFE